MAFTSNTPEEDVLLRARISDACHLCELRSCPRFVGFLDEHRQAVARAVLHEKGHRDFLFYGGYEGAVYFPAALSIQLCANISLSSSPQGIQAAGSHQSFTYSLVINVQRGLPADWTAGAENLFEEQERETQRELNSPSRATV